MARTHSMLPYVLQNYFPALFVCCRYGEWSYRQDNLRLPWVKTLRRALFLLGWMLSPPFGYGRQCASEYNPITDFFGRDYDWWILEPNQALNVAKDWMKELTESGLFYSAQEDSKGSILEENRVGHTYWPCPWTLWLVCDSALCPGLVFLLFLSWPRLLFAAGSCFLFVLWHWLDIGERNEFA